jgi:hypothetical protein
MVDPDFTALSGRFFEKGHGRQVIGKKVSVAPSASDDPGRSAFIDELLAKLKAEANG